MKMVITGWGKNRAMPALMLLVIFIFLATNAAQAQYLDPAQLKDLPPEIAKQFSKIPISDLMSGKARIQQNLPETSQKDPDWVSPLPVTLHLRGTSGTPLPDAESLRQRRMKLYPVTPADREQAIAQYQQLINKQLPAMAKLEKLPECHRDKSSYEQFPSPAGEGIVRDILFIQSTELPMNVEESFGASTIIVKYDPASPSSWSYYAKLSNIKCLPSRIRILGNGVSRLEGLPALKNYDKDPYGNGVLSDVIKSGSKRLFDQQGGE